MVDVTIAATVGSVEINPREAVNEPRRLYRCRSDRASQACGRNGRVPRPRPNAGPRALARLDLLRRLVHLLYIILAFVMPLETTGLPDAGTGQPGGPRQLDRAAARDPAPRGRAGLYVGTALVVLGAIALVDAVVPGWPATPGRAPRCSWPWESRSLPAPFHRDGDAPDDRPAAGPPPRPASAGETPMQLLRDLGRRKVRTTLTILGITIGIWPCSCSARWRTESTPGAGGSEFYAGKVTGLSGRRSMGSAARSRSPPRTGSPAYRHRRGRPRGLAPHVPTRRARSSFGIPELIEGQVAGADRGREDLPLHYASGPAP